MAGYSLNGIAALARHASMSTSYKPALLKALVRIVNRGCDEHVPLLTIGSEFVELYWVQTVTFRLRQAATVTSEPEVVRRIRRVAEVNGIRSIAALTADGRDRLNREMARVLTINVLDAFHKSKPIDMDVLFHWSAGEDAIRIPEHAGAFVRANVPALEALANLWWAKYLEKVNLLAPLVIEKVERNDAKRTSLARYLRILQEIDGAACFYCGRSFDEGSRKIHVDHVIPWSFLLQDPLWDLVLACAPCNTAKSDILPDRAYLAALVQTNLRRSTRTMPPGYASPLIDATEIDRYYEAALSVEWPCGWVPR